MRDPQHRPNIDSVLKRFEHIHGILVSNNPMSNRILVSQKQPSTSHVSLENSLETYQEILKNQSQLQLENNGISINRQAFDFKLFYFTLSFKVSEILKNC